MASNANNSKDQSKVHFHLAYLPDHPIELSFVGKESVKQSIQKLYKELTFKNEEIVYSGALTRERSFFIEMGNEDKMDWDNEKFSIGAETRFIEYWNDFLGNCLSQLSLQQNSMTHEEKTDFSLKYDGPMEATLDNKDSKRSVLKMGSVDITFHRTLRIPEDGKVYPLPPSMGTFELVKVQDFLNNPAVPQHWKERKGLIIPMWQKEALFIKFESADELAVKVSVGKVNAITGELYKRNKITYENKNKNTKQNYIAVPRQLWMDGINSGNYEIRQFVAMPLGKGMTVESQVQKQIKDAKKEKEKEKDKDKSQKGDQVVNNGDANKKDNEKKEDEIEKETVGGMQIEVFSKFNSNVQIYQVESKNGKKRRRHDDYLLKTPKELNLKANGEYKIQFYSPELPKKILIHELTWPEMMERIKEEKAEKAKEKQMASDDQKESKQNSNEFELELEFRRGKNSAIGFQHRVYHKWCETALRQQSPHNNKAVDAYLVIYGHSLGKTSYSILEFASRTRELIAKELDVKQLFSHGDFQNGNFYKYDKNYENLVKLTHTKSLKEQGLECGDVIRFIRKLEIYIDTQDGITHTLPINENLTDTIRSIKQKLKSNYQIRIDDKKQRLVTATTFTALNDMKDGKMASLKDYGIDIEDKLQIQTITEMILYIKTISGQKIAIDNIRPNFTIGTIKELLNSREGIPSEQQRLMFKGVQLDDKKSLESCGVGNEDTLNLELRLRGVCLTKGTKIIVQSKNDNNNGMSSHKLIENLVIGDIVLSYNVETNAFEYNKVMKVGKYRANELVTIKLLNKQSVVCTPNHLIYVDNKGTYVSAEEIEVGDELATVVLKNKNNNKDNYSKKIGRVESVTSEFYSNNETVEVYTIWVENTPNFFANGICVHNGSLMDVKIQLQSGEIYKIKVDVETDTVQDIKLKIQKLLNIHPQSQHLKTKKSRKLQDNRMIEFYKISNNEVIYLTIKEPKGQEMGLAVGGRMQQKLYIDSKSNFNMYDYKHPTRIFINIANGTLWKKITDKPLPASPLTSLTYQKFNYPWFYMYDESIEDLPESDILKKVKSVNDIENAQLSKHHSVGSLSSTKSVPPGKALSPHASGSIPDFSTGSDDAVLGGDNAASINIPSKIQHKIKHHEETVEDGHW